MASLDFTVTRKGTVYAARVKRINGIELTTKMMEQVYEYDDPNLAEDEVREKALTLDTAAALAAGATAQLFNDLIALCKQAAVNRWGD